MPEWFSALTLAVFLAGYVFLFLQGRLVRKGQQVLEARISELSGHMAALSRDQGAAAESLDELARKPQQTAEVVFPPFPEIPKPPSLAEIHEELEPRFKAVLEAVDQQSLAMDGLRASVAELDSIVKLATARPTEPSLLTPEEVARRFLLEEGFSRIHITGNDTRDGGTRFLVRAMRGDEVRSGHVVVMNGRVQDAAMKAPSALFP